MEVSNEIMRSRLQKTTLGSYASKINHLQEWLSRVHPECINVVSNVKQCILPIPCGVLQEFLGSICLRKDDDGNPVEPHEHLTYSYVSGYKSAIKNLYRQYHITMDNASVMMMDEFFGGYVRINR